jgi:succinoglycan biosynthesis transport protein ExoP
LSAYRSQLPMIASATLPALPSEEEQSAGGGISVTQVVTILRAYWKLSVIAALACISIGAVDIKLMPKKYVATATLLVNKDQTDPLAGRDGANGLETTFIPTQIELISSRIVLQPVVEKLNLLADPEFKAGFAGPRDAMLEAVVRNLVEAVQVQQGVGSQLLYVSASSKDPVKAAKIANAVTDEYLGQARQRTSAPAGERAARYSQELAELRLKATAAQDKVTDFRNQHGMTQIDSDKGDTDAAALTDLEQKLLAVQNQRRELESQQLGLRGASSSEAMGSTAVQSLRAQLSTQQTQMAELRATLGPQHPKILELQSEMAVTSRSLATELSRLSDNVTGQLARTRQLEAEYQRALDTERTKVIERRSVQDQAAKLLLELQSAQATYKRALDGYDQIVFASAANFNDVTSISRADPPVKALKPNKPKLFAIVCLLSLGLALAGPFAYELFLNRRLRCRDDLERSFGIPVLAQLGSISA